MTDTDRLTSPVPGMREVVAQELDRVDCEALARMFRDTDTHQPRWIGGVLAAMERVSSPSTGGVLEWHRFGENPFIRDDLNGEQSILVWREAVGVFDLIFLEAGEEWHESFAMACSHWCDITGLWPSAALEAALPKGER